MTKYTADEYELRAATTELGLATAPALSGWEKVDVKVKPRPQEVAGRHRQPPPGSP